MERLPFIGREKELADLNVALQESAGGQGHLVLIEGEAGIGKSFLIDAFQEHTRSLKTSNEIRFVLGRCYEDTGGNDAYQPFIEILEDLLKPQKRAGEIGQLILKILKETGSDWLVMIPGIGPAVSIGVKTATLAGEWYVGKKAGQPESLANQYTKSITRIAGRYQPMVLLIEDAHWIDEPSILLLLRLASRLKDLPLLVIVTYRPNYLQGEHPLLKLRYEVASRGEALILTLKGLCLEEIETYLENRFGAKLSSKMASWLMNLCAGHPLFIAQYLSLLEQVKIVRQEGDRYVLDGEIMNVAGEWELSGRIADLTPPTSIEMVLEQRIDRLLEEDREMLQLGAVQGEQFMSSVLAVLLKTDESDLLKRLRKVIENHHIISIYIGEDISLAHSEVYEFEHALMQKAFYNKLSPRERVLYHQNIARILEKSLADDQTLQSRRLLMEIAHHYDQGQEPRSAARYYFSAAQSLMAAGANIEAIEICLRALQNIRRVKNEERLLTEIIHLLLVTSRERGFQAVEARGQQAALELAREGEELADRLGDRELLARIKFEYGRILGEVHSLTECLVKLKEALELIHDVGHPVAEYVIMSEQGQQMRGQDFAAGYKLQREAREFFQKNVSGAGINLSPGILIEFYVRQSGLGVAELDRGNFSAALELLEDSVDNLKKLKVKDELVPGMNYLAQTLMAMGQFEHAEQILREALDLVEDDDEPHTWNGYNLALLGKLYLEWERVREAEEPLRRGWDESQRVQLKWQTPLVRNYYVELLMNRGSTLYNPEEAEYLLKDNLAETLLSGYQRSAVFSYSLWSLLAVRQNRIEEALKYGSQAVDTLEAMKDLPALRSEEIFFNQSRVLAAAGRQAEAQGYLEKALNILNQKAGTIADAEQCQMFYARVPVNREILRANQNKAAAALSS
jgi:predicted ATPase